MFGNTVGALGSGADSAYGYHARSQARGRRGAQEEQFVEGDLFGSTKRPNIRSAEPPAGRPPRAAYYDSAGAVASGNTFTNSSTGNGNSGAGGYLQVPVAQPSPFKRAPPPSNPFVSATGGGAALGSFYGSARYGSQVGAAAADTTQGLSSSNEVFGSEVALVPVDNGGGRGRNVMDDDDGDDDDFIPTRSLADEPDSREHGATVAAADGLRHRRAGGGESRAGNSGAGATGGVEADAQRATWVVVWGVPPDMANEVLTRFLQFGHVEKQRAQPSSNWLYLKYATRLQAEKALAAGHGSRLTETIMLGVQRVPDDETWHALREGRIPPLQAANPVLPRAASARATAAAGDAMEIDDADLLGAPPQRPREERSICGKIMAFFGFY